MQQQTGAASAPATTLAQAMSILATHRADLAARYHLNELGVFGSYVRGEQHATSDLDILVSFDITPSFFTLAALEDDLRDLLGVPVDVALKSALRPHIGAHILREVVLV